MYSPTKIFSWSIFSFAIPVLFVCNTAFAIKKTSKINKIEQLEEKVEELENKIANIMDVLEMQEDVEDEDSDIEDDDQDNDN